MVKKVSGMADDCLFFNKDIIVIKTIKKSPLVLMMVLMAFSVICGIYIFLICLKQTSLKQISAHTKPSSLLPKFQAKPSSLLPKFQAKPSSLLPKFQVIQRPCHIPLIHREESLYVHYPIPKTYSRGECICTPVRFFAILSMQRSGSGWFEALLNSHHNISSNGEIFYVKARRSNFSSILNTLDEVYNMEWYSRAAKNECSAAVGFRWMLNQGVMKYPREIVKYFNRKGVSTIFLFRRNLLHRLVSVLANNYDRNAKLLNGTHKGHVHSEFEALVLAKYKPTINVKSLLSDLKNTEKMMADALNYFKTTRHIVLYYEDLVNKQTKLVDVQEFLRVAQRKLVSHQVKIHTGPFSVQVKNWDDVRRTLKRSRYKNFLERSVRKSPSNL